MMIPCEKKPILDNIIKGLFLGDIVAATNLDLLKTKQINVIISLVELKMFSENVSLQSQLMIEYHSFLIDDNRNEDIFKFFNQTNDLIDKSLKEGKNVLVNCQNAVSRSVTIILAYLLSKNLSLKDSLDMIKDNRTSTFTRPNSGFAKQLIKYEKTIRNINSITLSEMLGSV